MKQELAKLPRIQAMSDNIYDPVWSEKLHNTNNFELLHVMAGHFELTYADGRRFPAGPGDTLLTPPGMAHRDNFDMSQELEIFLVQFHWDADREVTDRYGNGWLRRQTPEDRRTLRNFFDLLRLESASDALSGALAESILLSTLLVLYRAAVPRETATANAAPSTKQQHLQLILRAKKYIHRHYREPIRLADAAGYLQVSSFHLSRIFSRESDFSFFDYLLEVRLNEAKQLLASGRYRVGEVALRVGYEDAGYFCRLFKARAGCTPKEYSDRARLSTI